MSKMTHFEIKIIVFLQAPPPGKHSGEFTMKLYVGRALCDCGAYGQI